MTTPFDEVTSDIARARYHNQRLETHSDIVSDGIVRDLRTSCESFREDVDSGAVRIWRNVSAPGNRRRRVDLFVGEPGPAGEPDVRKMRIAIENKSVITAHRNRTNRFDDLQEVLAVLHGERPQAILIATVLVGLSERVLNVPDRLHPLYRDRESEFQRDVLPRLSTGDGTLWQEFRSAVSSNRPNDPAKTVDLFRTLPTRSAGHTHVKGYDYVLLAPLWIDNVSPPSVGRDNSLGIDIDSDFEALIKQMCQAYRARWHM